MFRLYEIESCEEKEIVGRILANAHAALDAKYPETKLPEGDSYTENAFSVVEDTISEEDPRKNATPGVPETRDAMPITKSGQFLGGKLPEKPAEAAYNKDLGEFTQFSLDEPTQVTAQNKREAQNSGSFVSKILILIGLVIVVIAAIWYFQKNS